MDLYKFFSKGVERSLTYLAEHHPAIKQATRFLPDSFLANDQRVQRIIIEKNQAEARASEATACYLAEKGRRAEQSARLDRLTARAAELETQIAKEKTRYEGLEGRLAVYQQQSGELQTANHHEIGQLRSLARQQNGAMVQMRRESKLEAAKALVYAESESEEFGLALNRDFVIATASSYAAKKLGLSDKKLSQTDIYDIVANSGETRKQIASAIEEKQRIIRLPGLVAMNHEGKPVQVGEAIVRIFYSPGRDGQLEYAAASITTEAAHGRRVLKRYRRMKRALRARKTERNTLSRLRDFSNDLRGILNRTAESHPEQ